MRSGASGRPSASCTSCSAFDRVVRSPPRRVLCRVSACAALRCTVSSRAFLSPRCGTRTPTRAPRTSASEGLDLGGVRRVSAGTSTSRGIASRPASPYTWSSSCSTRSPVDTSSTFSTTQPRWPRTRPSRTWKTWTAASRSSSASAKTSASVPSGRTTALFSRAFRRAARSSRSRAARSYSIASLASRICCSMRRTKRCVCPAMKSQKSSASCRWAAASTRPTHGAEHLSM